MCSYLLYCQDLLRDEDVHVAQALKVYLFCAEDCSVGSGYSVQSKFSVFSVVYGSVSILIARNMLPVKLRVRPHRGPDGATCTEMLHMNGS